MKKFGIIVDGYSTGGGLASEFMKHGVSCLHVQGQATVPQLYFHTYVASDYYSHFVYENNMDFLVEQLRHYNPMFVIAGAECGIELADYLAEKLKLPGNGTGLSACRRNKYRMVEQIQSKGLQSIPSFQANTLDEAIVWASAQEKWPLMIKPLTSAGGEGVKICRSLMEVMTAYSDIMEMKTNMLGFENTAVIIQHYIYGEEFVVNTVSYEGEHKFCELWGYTRYTRPQGRQIYDTANIIHYQPEKHADIISYTIKVLDALGIQFGPAHVEIIKNEDGCFLIEIGARLMGANLPFALLQQCIGTPQALLTVDAYVNPLKFKECPFNLSHVIQPLTAVFMVSNTHGVIQNVQLVDKICSLESFFQIKLAVKVGDILRETIDYKTSPGMIYLSHPDVNVIKEDIIKIREFEKNMFQLEKHEEPVLL